MKKSEIKIFKEEYESYKEKLLYFQEKLDQCNDPSYKIDIICYISSYRQRIEFLEDLSYKLNISHELGL